MSPSTDRRGARSLLPTRRSTAGSRSWKPTRDRATAGSTIDLWFGDRQLHVIGCTTPTPAASGGTSRCTGAWGTQSTGSHDDAGALVFDATVAVDGCPLVYSSDGGVHTNTSNASPACHAASWNEANVGMHALWLYAMTGADQAGVGNEDLYMGAQDTGSFASTDAGSANPSWTMPNCCDVFNIVADTNRVIWDVVERVLIPARRAGHVRSHQHQRSSTRSAPNRASLYSTSPTTSTSTPPTAMWRSRQRPLHHY